MTSVCLVRRIAARPAVVFEALVTAEGIRAWWGPGLEHECAGEFLEIERPERVVMSWRWTHNGQIDEHDNVSRVEMRVRAIDMGTELTLVHSLLRNEDSARAHEGGWDKALQKLMRMNRTGARR